MEVEQTIQEEEFYKKAVLYWSEIPPTIDGMLGGFGHISQIDIRSSKQFLRLLSQSKHPPGKITVADCGAGIGRISKHLLSHIFERLDLIEQNHVFLEQAKEYLGPTICNKIDNFYNVGLQDFYPEEGRYDVIWCQWVLGHLTDVDFVKFLERCKLGLKKDGVVIIKENIASSRNVETDEKDSSVTRPYYLYNELFQKANFHCWKKIKQNNFPKGLYTVYMFAIRPQD
ncbi:methyltransferase [Oryctes borbonicus]|uniref:Alpha N-terminal protein methyltransferase 1 n=1 Tax=Oryctes borbonicus TaxID=1629725 RepID=A0A0T6B7E7_9SCAR|nr:methyltransferase [Oryctes borbonicus]